ncbi:MAG: 6-bladed beta-propeller [Prevotellaceae bacterium]|jgi:hypothetical protein|nr:6-bladed beta-propeller [Prevotellaceae bacterium]
MKKIIFTAINLCILISSCSTDRQNTDIADSSILIDLDKIERKDTVRTSSIFRKVRTVILEDNDSALIGNIDRIEVFDSAIFVIDAGIAKRIFVYNMEGGYIRQIGNQGRGPGEYLHMTDFCIDRDNRHVCVLDDAKKRIHRYNADNGKYAGSIKLPDDVSVNYIACNNNRFYVTVCSYDLSQRDNMMLEIDVPTSKFKMYISAGQYNLGWNANAFSDFNFFVSKNYPFKYAGLYMNTVIAITNDSIYPYVTLKSKDWVKKTDLLPEEEVMNGASQEVITYKKNRMERIHSYMESDGYIYFEYYQRVESYPVIYDKHTKEIRHYNFLKNDLVFGKGTPDTKFYYTTPKAAYDYLNFDRLNRILDGIEDSTVELASSLDKREDIANLDRERFVIFEYEFK